MLDEFAAKDAIFARDVGTPTIWVARYLTMNSQRRLLASFTQVSMANALAQAIGAPVSHPGRQVVALSGDGGLAMLMGDLLSRRPLQWPLSVSTDRCHLVCSAWTRAFAPVLTPETSPPFG